MFPQRAFDDGAGHLQKNAPWGTWRVEQRLPPLQRLAEAERSIVDDEKIDCVLVHSTTHAFTREQGRIRVVNAEALRHAPDRTVSAAPERRYLLPHRMSVRQLPGRSGTEIGLGR